MAAPPYLAHPSCGPWPHRELHRRLQWPGPHGGAASFWRTRHTVCGPFVSVCDEHMMPLPKG
eukprot:2256094-Pyramimonas_sp.AAC.1